MRVVSRFAVFALFNLLAAGTLSAQSAADLEARLSASSGRERARTLSQLVNAYKLDKPLRALEYGAEALRILDTLPDPPTRVATLNEMGWAHMTLGRYDSATAYGEKARQLAASIRDRTGEARALSNLGTLAQRMGDPHRAVELFTDALALQRAAGSEVDVANSLNNLGFVYSTDLADYAKSLSYHLESLAIRQRLGDKAAIALSLNNIGIVYGRLRQPRRALEYYEQALAIRRELKSMARVAATLNNIGDTYLEMRDYPRALASQREALAIRSTLRDQSAIALSHHNIGVIHVAMGNFEAGRAEFDTAQRIIEAAGGDRGIAVQIHLGQASLERQAGSLSQAARHARLALAIADTMGSRELVRRSSEALASIEEERGELAAALATLKRSKVVSDSIFNAEAARQIAALEERYRAERRARELEELRRREAELALQAHNRTMQRDAIAAFTALLLVAGIFLYRRRVDRLRLVEQMSVTDALTGVRNRRYLEQTIERDLASSLRRYRAAAERCHAPEDPDVVFFFLDLDGFKEVNDLHGHVAGDRLLIELARVLENTARDSDLVVRWGGDEFVVVGRFMDHRSAAVAAERIRAAVADHVFEVAGGQRVSVTCSIGYAPFPFGEGDTGVWRWQDVIRLADAAAYSAKAEGGNRWAGYLPSRIARVTGAGWDAKMLTEWVASGRIRRESGASAVDAQAASGSAAIVPEVA